MIYTVVRSRQADEDLMEIWLYIAKDNPTSADKLLDDIENAWAHLQRYPLSGQARSDVDVLAR